MKLILVTHAQSNRDIGLMDKSESLSEIGCIEARQLAFALKPLKIDHVYCSTAERCEQTMDAFLGEKPEENISVVFSRFLGPKTTKESLVKLEGRVKVFLDELTYDHKEEEVLLVVTHRLVAAMINFVLTAEHVPIEQASISIFEIDGESKKLIKINDTEHLK